jgi:uncharacterized membrane protein
MAGSPGTARLLVQVSWIALLAWQPAWHILLLPPFGSANGLLGLVALTLLLPLTPGVLRLRHRSLTLGSFLVMIYFMVGVMEAWSNPPQRFAALVQVGLTLGYFAGVVWLSRQSRQAQD